MTFQEKIKTGDFWKNTVKIALMFFVFLVIISLLINSFSDIFKFDIEAVKATNFSEGKWKRFVVSKIVIAFLYGMFVTNKNIK
jgi:hypothetical protein